MSLMSKQTAINWMTNLIYEIGEVRHQDLWGYGQALCEILELLEQLPDAEPKYKTGKWIEGFIADSCSECGYNGNFHMNFCPNCGAKMD